MALSPILILPTFLETWMIENALNNSIFADDYDTDPLERLDKLGLELPKLDPYDSRQFSVNAESRFRIQFIVGVMAFYYLPIYQDHFSY